MRLPYNYIHEEMKICCDGPIKDCIPTLLKLSKNRFGRKSSEILKQKIRKLVLLGDFGIFTPVY